jgi:cobalamin biosynthesis protein CobT
MMEIEDIINELGNNEDYEKIGNSYDFGVDEDEFDEDMEIRKVRWYNNRNL